MLSWSPGLKNLLALPDEEISDEQLAQQDDQLPEEEMIYRLDIDQWKLVMSRNARYEMLLIAAKNGRAGIEALLEELATRPPTHSGQFMPYAQRRFH